MTQPEVEALIREHSAATGSLPTALHRVQELLLSPEHRRLAVDVFPADQLASSLDRLCRCRGMIQEVQPEVNLFCAHRQHFFSSGTSGEADDDSDVEFVDAVSLYVIPVPGNDHFYTVDGASVASPSLTPVEAHGERKRRDRDGGAAPCEDGPRRGAKAARTTAEVNDGEPQTAVSSSVHDAAAGRSLNFPHPSRHPQLQTACIVTVLLPPAVSAASDSELERRRNPFRINDVVDFYGFQHFPDDQLAANEEDDFLRFSAWNAAELSKGLVSRLLCLAYQPVASIHLPRAVSTADLEEAAVVAQRALAHRYLCEQLTSGDALAAEYVLLHLCARVSVHSDATPVGDLPLLITAPQLSAEAWSLQLRRIAPIGEVLLNRETLTCASSPSLPTTPRPLLTPKYNNELNFLQSGVLQVANGSHITFDCTGLGLQDGAWYEGVFSLVHKQQLLLDYPYQTLELPVDVSVLALHEGVDTAALHPLFQFALRVRWEPSTAQSSIATAPATAAVAAAAARSTPERDAAQDSSQDAASDVRRYIAAMRHLSERSPAPVDEEMTSQTSAALLAMTREIPGWNNRDPLLHNNSFSVATALMQAHAASCGRRHFNAADVAAVQELEKARMARLPRVSAA